MSERELRSELRLTRGLLAAANCPDPGCVLGWVTGRQISDGAWEGHVCEWCTERFALIGDG